MRINFYNRGQSLIVIGIIIVLVVVGLIGGLHYYLSKQIPEVSEITKKPAEEEAAKPEDEIVQEEDVASSKEEISPKFVCGDSVTFTYKGSSVTYGTVESQGECWMDRNLGASRRATAYNDSWAYGDLFQWGRLDDGHQTRYRGITTTLSSTDVPGHSNFIYGQTSVPYDWRKPQNDNLWQGVSGINNPCPSGWRIPTETEWETERLSWSSNDWNGAFTSPLKLTVGGRRDYHFADYEFVGDIGYYWSSTVSGMYARSLSFTDYLAGMGNRFRAFGFSVRCIKD